MYSWLPVLRSWSVSVCVFVYVGFVMDSAKFGRFILRGVQICPTNSTNAPYVFISRFRYNGFDSRQCRLFSSS